MIKASNDPKQRAMLEEFNRVLDYLWKGKHCEIGDLEDDKLEKKKSEFYPAIIVNCKYRNEIHNGRSSAGTKDAKRSFIDTINFRDCHSLLASKIITQKIIHKKIQTNKKLYFGTCAEDDAANKILLACDNKKIPQPPKLSDLKYTIPIRPRTREKEKYCIICEKIFG